MLNKLSLKTVNVTQPSESTRGNITDIMCEYVSVHWMTRFNDEFSGLSVNNAEICISLCIYLLVCMSVLFSVYSYKLRNQ